MLFLRMGDEKIGGGGAGGGIGIIEESSPSLTGDTILGPASLVAEPGNAVPAKDAPPSNLILISATFDFDRKDDVSFIRWGCLTSSFSSFLGMGDTA